MNGSPNPDPAARLKRKKNSKQEKRVRTILLAARSPYPSIPTHLRATWEPNPGRGLARTARRPPCPTNQELREKSGIR